MQKELEELQPKLAVAKEENAKMMTVIEKESSEVAARSEVVKRDEAVANKQAAEAQALKDEVGAQLRCSWWFVWRILPIIVKCTANR